LLPKVDDLACENPAGDDMMRKAVLIAFFVLALFQFWGKLSSQKAGPRGLSVVYHLKIGTEVDNVLATYIARTLSIAERDGAELVVVEINTPGGEMGGMWKISDSLVSTRIPTVAWINKNAASAGAMITYACNYIVMAPGATFGACVPVLALPIPTELPEIVSKKYVSYTKGQIHSIAAARGHDADIAEAMVDESKEIDFSEKIPAARRQKLLKALNAWDKATPEEKEEFKWFLDSSGELSEAKREALKAFLAEDAKIIEKGKILTLDTDKAFLLKVAIGKAASLDEIFELKEIKQLNLGQPVVKRVRWSWSELAAKFLSSPLVSSLLLIGGIVGIATELKVPGFGFPGILGISCILLLFFGNYAAGAAQWTHLILFGLGAALLLVELFVIPGFGFVGILGIIMIAASVFLMLLRSPGPDLPPTREEVVNVIKWMSLSVIIGAAAVYIVFKLVSPRTPLLGRLILADAQKAQIGYTAGAGFAAQADRLLGKVGEARTILRPAGKAVFDGKLFDVVTQGDIIERGSKIQIIEVKGSRIVVQRTKEN